MYASVSVMILVNGAPKSIFTEQVNGDDLDDLKRAAEKVGEEFAEKNPHIKIYGMKLTISIWM